MYRKKMCFKLFFVGLISILANLALAVDTLVVEDFSKGKQQKWKPKKKAPIKLVLNKDSGTMKVDLPDTGVNWVFCYLKEPVDLKKQLEENPWDVFEDVFTLNSTHQGTVTAIHDKGAVVSLPYGVEGFVPSRHLKKEDGSNIKVDETIDFVVIEFSKENKKIILSHSRIFEEDQRASKVKNAEAAKTEEQKTQRSMKKVNEKLEKTTFGDLDVLANLKSDLENEEKADKK